MAITFHVHYEDRRQQYLQLLFRHADLFADHGFLFRDCGDSCAHPGADGYILQNGFLTAAVLTWDAPVILAERRDSAVLFWRTYSDHPNVRAIWKLNVADFAYQNLTGERVHSYLMGVDQPPPVREITRTEFEKIHIAPNYGVFEPMRRWLVDRSPVRKTIPASFRGKIHYPNAPEIRTHREKCIRELGKIRRSVASVGRRPFPQYDRELRQSRVVVSPWGYGETCWRDIEAYFAGAILVKPWSGYVHTWPELFDPASYIACSPDLEGLADCVNIGLDQEARFTEAIARNREMVRQAWEPERIVNQMLPALRACLL